MISLIISFNFTDICKATSNCNPVFQSWIQKVSIYHFNLFDAEIYLTGFFIIHTISLGCGIRVRTVFRILIQLYVSIKMKENESK